MSVFPFFNKKKQPETDYKEESFEFGNDTVKSPEQHAVPSMVLSIPSDWNISKEKEYVLKFLSNDLPNLQPNQISLAGTSLRKSQDGNSWDVEAFIRSSLPKPITLNTVELMLLNNEDNIIAVQEFNFSEIGKISSNTNVPWVFKFHTESVTVSDIPAEGWKLAFNIQSIMPHSIDFAGSWDENLTQLEKQHLSELVDSLPLPKKNEINITGFHSKFTEDGSLAISVLIRNGSKKNIQMDNIPLEVKDAKNCVVARGAFKIKDFIIKSNTSKPWTFIFSQETLLEKQPDMSRWSAYIIEK